MPLAAKIIFFFTNRFNWIVYLVAQRYFNPFTMKINHALRCTMLLVFFGNLVMAQGDTQPGLYEDLRNLYMDQKYEKLISKAAHYVENEKTRKDAAPYLYLSKAYFEISQNEEYAEKFPQDRAFRNALKWASKYRRRDVEGRLYRENDFYFNALKKAALAEAASYLSEQKFSQAKRYYDAICDFDPDNAGAWLMLGSCEIQMRATQEAKLSFLEAGKRMQSLGSVELSSTDQNLLRKGVLTYAEILINNNMGDSAQATLKLAEPILEGDAEFDMYFKKVD